MSQKNIIITTGGTGGHIYPARTMAEALVKKGHKVTIFADKKYKKYHHKSDVFKHTIIPCSKIKNGFFAKIIATFFISIGIFKCLALIPTKKVSLVIAFGGYSTFPCLISSVILRKKIILHEQNSYIGKVNRIFLKYSIYTATSFKNTQGIKDEYKYKIKYLGNPVREEIAEIGKKEYNYPNFNKKYFSKNNLGYDLVLASDFEEVKKVKDDYFNILVIGGSGGAEIFSKILPKAFFNIRSELKNKINISQQCRANLLSNTFEQYQDFNLNVCLKDFFYDMDKKIEKSHLVIARSGSSTIFELASAKKPIILIPFKDSSDNHQLKNAQEAKKYGGSIVIEEKDFNINNVSKTIERLIDNPKILQKMSRDIYKFAKVNSIINFTKLIENT